MTEICLIINGNIHLRCSCCGYYIGSIDTSTEVYEWNYCPKCGEPLYEEM